MTTGNWRISSFFPGQSVPWLQILFLWKKGEQLLGNNLLTLTDQIDFYDMTFFWRWGHLRSTYPPGTEEITEVISFRWGHEDGSPRRISILMRRRETRVLVWERRILVTLEEMDLLSRMRHYTHFPVSAMSAANKHLSFLGPTSSYPLAKKLSCEHAYFLLTEKWSGCSEVDWTWSSIQDGN